MYFLCNQNIYFIEPCFENITWKVIGVIKSENSDDYFFCKKDPKKGLHYCN